MNRFKNVLTLALALLFPHFAEAQIMSSGIFNSYKGIGFSIQAGTRNPKEFNTFVLYADMAQFYGGKSTSPGVKFNFSHNTRLHTFGSSEGEDVCLYAGSGASTGWVQDFGKDIYGAVAALSGTFGVRAAFPRGALLTLGLTLETGFFIFDEGRGIRFSLYKNGIYKSLYPHVIIAVLFK